MFKYHVKNKGMIIRIIFGIALVLPLSAISQTYTAGLQARDTVSCDLKAYEANPGKLQLLALSPGYYVLFDYVNKQTFYCSVPAGTGNTKEATIDAAFDPLAFARETIRPDAFPQKFFMSTTGDVFIITFMPKDPDEPSEKRGPESYDYGLISIQAEQGMDYMGPLPFGPFSDLTVTKMSPCIVRHDERYISLEYKTFPFFSQVDESYWDEQPFYIDFTNKEVSNNTLKGMEKLFSEDLHQMQLYSYTDDGQDKFYGVKGETVYTFDPGTTILTEAEIPFQEKLNLRKSLLWVVNDSLAYIVSKYSEKGYKKSFALMVFNPQTAQVYMLKDISPYCDDVQDIEFAGTSMIKDISEPRKLPYTARFVRYDIKLDGPALIEELDAPPTDEAGEPEAELVFEKEMPWGYTFHIHGGLISFYNWKMLRVYSLDDGDEVDDHEFDTEANRKTWNITLPAFVHDDKGIALQVSAKEEIINIEIDEDDADIDSWDDESPEHSYVLRFGNKDVFIRNCDMDSKTHYFGQVTTNEGRAVYTSRMEKPDAWGVFSYLSGGITANLQPAIIGEHLYIYDNVYGKLMVFNKELQLTDSLMICRELGYSADVAYYRGRHKAYFAQSYTALMLADMQSQKLYYYERESTPEGKLYLIDLESKKLKPIDIDLPKRNSPIQIEGGRLYYSTNQDGKMLIWALPGKIKP